MSPIFGTYAYWKYIFTAYAGANTESDVNQGAEKSFAKVKAICRGRIPKQAIPIIVAAHGSRHCGGGRP